MLRSLLAAAVVSAAAVAQPPAAVPPAPLPLPIPVPPAPPPPAEVAPPPPMSLPNPAPVAEGETASALETLTAPRLVVGGDIGPVFGGWGLWRNGTLRPNADFAARPLLFPVPVADYAHDIKYNTSLAGRASAAYTFERIPLTATASWETYHRHAETLLLGYDPDTARLFDGLNAYNQRIRKGDDSYEDQDTDADAGTADHRAFPRLQMRTLPGDAHRLRSRVAVNVADASLAYKVWTPREDRGWEYRVVAGGRWGGFFADDRAVGDRYEQTASNWYSGFGPEGGVRIDYRLRKGGTVLWADVRGGSLFGEATQRFREVDFIWGGDRPYRELVQRADRTVPFLATELGLGGTGAGLRFAVGVRYSHYWGIGDVGPSRLDFAAVAGFLRLELGF